jgi:hypothetical protein
MTEMFIARPDLLAQLRNNSLLRTYGAPEQYYLRSYKHLAPTEPCNSVGLFLSSSDYKPQNEADDDDDDGSDG